MYEFIKIATLILLWTMSIFIVVWIFRPGTAKRYEKFSKIPLKDDLHFEVKKKSVRKGQRKKAK
ncbi:MAG: cbb3-type cytochrome c oxidase subunit 3 [Rickettsiales bacterium]